MSQSKSLRPEGAPDEEMTLADLWQMLRADRYLILGSTVVALVVAAIYLATTPSQYEATLVVKVGQVGVATGLAQQVEAPGEVIGRMQGPEFKNAVVASLGWKGDEREHLFKYSLQITNPADKHLKIRVYGFSPGDARRAVEASLATLAEIHRALAESIVAERERGVAKIVADIVDTEDFLRRIEPLGKKDISSNSHEWVVAFLQAQAEKEAKIRLSVLRAQEREMRDSMRPEFIKPTMVAEPVVVSSQPVYPNARRVWNSAAIGGLLLALLLVLLRSIARMNKESGTPVTQKE